MMALTVGHGEDGDGLMLQRCCDPVQCWAQLLELGPSSMVSDGRWVPCDDASWVVAFNHVLSLST